ncbi:MAG: hypothetical protein WD906_02260 [Anaerolineales bacterium]
MKAAAGPPLKRIAFYRGRRDEVPNQVLARELAARRDAARIREIANGLRHGEPGVQSDCLKVLYEVGYLRPELIAKYTPDFTRLLAGRNNRLVWGAMTALAAVAQVRPKAIYGHRREIIPAMKAGSVITVDQAVLALTRTAASSPSRRRDLLPVLYRHLSTCRPKDVPQHAEKIAPAVDKKGRARCIAILSRRMPEMPVSQRSRVRKLIRHVEG